MTDTNTTNQPAKAMWTRCNACQDRIYNNSHDIKIHAQHCPFDLQMTIQKLTVAIFGTHELPKGQEPLTSRVDDLEQMIGDLDEHVSAEPALDPDAIDVDAYTDVIGDNPTSTYEDDDLAFPRTRADDLGEDDVEPPINPSGLYAPTTAYNAQQ